MTVIRVENLTKKYLIYKRKNNIKYLFSSKAEERTAVDGINFEIEEGEFVGFIGPNGAGKSTTIKMMTGVLFPTTGDITVLGFNPHKNRKLNAQKIGVVFGQRTQLWWNLPLIESFELIKFMYKIDTKRFKYNMEYFDSLLGIANLLQTPVRQLSLGQRMQSELVASILHDPEVIYLDEPTIGVDIVAKGKIRSFLKELNSTRKTTIILTTHDLQDIEKLVDRTIIINKGKIIYDGKLEGLKKFYNNEKIITVEFNSEVIDLSKYPCKVIEENGRRRIITVENNYEKVFRLLQEISADYSIKDISFHDVDIERTIIKLYEG